jgi:thymidine phosphorylase
VVADPGRLPRAAHVQCLDAPADGYVTRIDAELVGRASMLLGAGRDRVDAIIDPATGIVVEKKPGEQVLKGEPVLSLHYNDHRRLQEALPLGQAAIEVGTQSPVPEPLIRAWVHADGETSYV